MRCVVKKKIPNPKLFSLSLSALIGRLSGTIFAIFDLKKILVSICISMTKYRLTFAIVNELFTIPWTIAHFVIVLFNYLAHGEPLRSSLDLRKIISSLEDPTVN